MQLKPGPVVFVTFPTLRTFWSLSTVSFTLGFLHFSSLNFLVIVSFREKTLCWVPSLSVVSNVYILWQGVAPPTEGVDGGGVGTGNVLGQVFVIMGGGSCYIFYLLPVISFLI